MFKRQYILTVALSFLLVSCAGYWDGENGEWVFGEGQFDPLVGQTERVDEDGDGYSPGENDCDDNNDQVNPGMVEVAYNGIDDDCEGGDMVDQDGDGGPSDQVEGGEDCDDEDINVNPSAEEICNQVDDDCDGLVDDADEDVVGQGTWYIDEDGDGFGVKEVQSCIQPGNGVTSGGDCNDDRPSYYPGAPETSCGADQDCDGFSFVCDDSTDDDGDGFAESHGDCNDKDPDINPEAPELCDGVDDDCDGLIDEEDPDFRADTCQ